MARWSRYGSRRYNKPKSFSRNYTRSYRGRGQGYYQAPRENYQRASDVNVVVGRRRIWIFNNTEDPVVVMPGQYVVLEIVREGDNQLGHFFRATVLENNKAEASNKAPEAPEERPQDWV